jgi:hypothetical protein
MIVISVTGIGEEVNFGRRRAKNPGIPPGTAGVLLAEKGR